MAQWDTNSVETFEAEHHMEGKLKTRVSNWLLKQPPALNLNPSQQLLFNEVANQKRAQLVPSASSSSDKLSDRQ